MHREHFDPNEVQLSTLLSIKTGGCPEDCGYCPQSVHYDTGVEASKLLDPDAVLAAARAAREQGASRFCMGAAWRAPKDRDIEKVAELVSVVKAAGPGDLRHPGHADRRRQREPLQGRRPRLLQPQPGHRARGLRRHHHHPQLRRPPADTLQRVRGAGIKVCCGGIVGMGETRRERAGLIAQLANLDPYPESVPINNLVQVEGTPLHGTEPLDPFEFVRTIAVARITMPTARVRLSAGRQQMGDAVQALCFMAGANSIFYGDKLLTTGNPDWAADQRLLGNLGITAR